ncbi:MAG: ABC transporter ATP-binding protein [Synergistaceae bacterium]|jgi:oligopeptide/dipeptide ABC transporter ATP-binding protein|uniref:ABC transporter ATP-binding protein n=1 Tax=Aminivibrio sp. TaxID=1872489 RepID=UPI00356BF510|nr:ABC transporter ATP-binding protein [Synergistaceae bacterium]MDD4020814.1 ABC transporter ATP-binding protein [Synergistaceae bacterium]
MSKILSVNNLTVHFHTEAGIVRALEDVSFSIEEGEVLGLVGETGCGKSVTALSVMGLVPVPPGKILGGTIEFGGRNLLSLDSEEMRAMRGKDLAMIFQDPMSSLNPVFTAGFQVEEAIVAHEPGASGKSLLSRVIGLFKKVNISDPEQSVQKYPHMLSGGMKQRVMIAMGLSCGPKLIIADEPTTALDVSIQAQILTLIRRLQREGGSSVLLISHDLGVIAAMAQRVAVMYAGSIVECTSVGELFENPRHPYTKGLLGAIPRLDKDQTRLAVIPGTLPDLLNLPEGCKFRERCPEAIPICSSVSPRPQLIGPGHEVACHACFGN